MGEYSGAARSPPSFPSASSAALPGLVVRVKERDLKTGPGTGPRAAPSDVAVTRDGTRIAYALHGDGKDGIALIHSLAMDRRFWQPVVERLARPRADEPGSGRVSGARTSEELPRWPLASLASAASTLTGSGQSASHHPAFGISVPSKNPGGLIIAQLGLARHRHGITDLAR